VSRPRSYPVDLDVAGRSCLVVGGGRVGARKALSLAECGAEVTIVAPVLSEAALAVPGARCERRPYRPGEASAYWLVVTATGDPAVDGAVYEDAVAARVWVNSADDPEHCTFTLPAVHRQGPVVVTVSTGGASPALSSWLRDELSVCVGPEFAELAERLAARRTAIHALGESTEGRGWTTVIEAELARLRAQRGGVERRSAERGPVELRSEQRRRPAAS
jgi:siroheme synthase-like protein